jgi:hypothetical protein
VNNQDILNKSPEAQNFAKYEGKTFHITKDGHTMLYEDIVKDLNRKSFLESELIEFKNRIAKLEKDKAFLLTKRFMGNTIISTDQGLSDAIKAHNLEQQTIGFDAAIDAALDLDLIENDVHVCNSIKEQAKAKGGTL